MGNNMKCWNKRLRSIMFLCGITLSLMFMPSVNALSETYYNDWNLPFDENSTGFSYSVEVDFQTEENGKWTFDNTYTITYTISITYVNESYFDSDFYVQFFEPELTEQLLGRNLDIVKNSCIVDQGQSGTIVARFKPDPSFIHLDEEESTRYEASLRFKVYKNQEAIPYDYIEWQWMSDYSIPITFEEEQNTTNFNDFQLVGILSATILVVSVIGYLIYRRRKKKF